MMIIAVDAAAVPEYILSLVPLELPKPPAPEARINMAIPNLQPMMH